MIVDGMPPYYFSRVKVYDLREFFNRVRFGTVNGVDDIVFFAYSFVVYVDDVFH